MELPLLCISSVLYRKHTMFGLQKFTNISSSSESVCYRLKVLSLLSEVSTISNHAEVKGTQSQDGIPVTWITKKSLSSQVQVQFLKHP